MKKVKFIGVVNGVEYDNVGAYNEAINNALETGEVNAYTKTELVDNEPEPEPVIKKYVKFTGVVNGIEYDNVESYNEAVTKALEGGVVNAYTKTETCQCCDNCECESESENVNGENCSSEENLPDINYLPGFFENGEEITSEYIDNNVYNSDDTDWTNHCDNLSCRLGQSLNEIDNALSRFSSEDRNEYLKDIEDVLNKIYQDEAANNMSIDSLTKNIQTLKTSIDEIHNSINENENSLFVCNRASQIINLYKSFYETLKHSVGEIDVVAGGNEDVVETQITETNPQNVMEINDSQIEKEVESVVRKFLNKIFG